MIHQVIRYPNPILETPCEEVSEFDTPELHQLVADMFETMYRFKGVGLAAPQIAISKRIAVIDTSLGEDETSKIVIINPEITLKEGKVRDEEGCLCLPGFHEKVTRAQHVEVRARDATGAEVTLSGDDLLARAFQHEIDHLNGILFIKHISALKRDLIRRKIQKLIKAGEWS